MSYKLRILQVHPSDGMRHRIRQYDREASGRAGMSRVRRMSDGGGRDGAEQVLFEQDAARLARRLQTRQRPQSLRHRQG